LPNIIRAVGQALAFAPLSAVATAGIEKENAGSASALFNMMRNLGGAMGIAMLQTFLTKREQFHSNVLTPSVSLFAEATRARIQELTRYFLSHGVSDQGTALHKAIVAIGNVVRKQAFVMAFGDTFYLLGAVLIVALIATLLLKKSEHLDAGGARDVLQRHLDGSERRVELALQLTLKLWSWARARRDRRGSAPPQRDD
jgi:DHA2 family multidrug resistance protein